MADFHVENTLGLKVMPDALEYYGPAVEKDKITLEDFIGIESSCGYDLITGEDLTEMERSMKLVGAIVDLVTLATGLYGFSTAVKNMGWKKATVYFAQLTLVELASDVSAATVATIGEHYEWPTFVTLLLSLGTGITVGQVGNHLIFKRNGIEIFRKEVGESGGIPDDNGMFFEDLMSPEDAARYSNWGNLREAGLDQKGVNDIILTSKGYRPDPVTYLPQEYIDTHLAQFDDGISVIQTEWAYCKYSEVNGFVGVPDDNTLFVMPKNLCDDVIDRAHGDISIIERELGFPEGYFKDGCGLVRIDVDDISEINLRIPSGNESGANNLWVPGGYTLGGVPEAITNTIPLVRTKITKIDVK